MTTPQPACQHNWLSFVPDPLLDPHSHPDPTFHAMFTDTNRGILIHEKCAHPDCGLLRWAYYRRAPDGAGFTLVDQDTAFGNLFRRFKPREAAGEYD